MCQRQLPALTLISTAAFQGLIEVVIGAPSPDLRALLGPSPCALQSGCRFFLSSLPLLGLGLPLQPLMGWGRGSGCPFQGWEEGS